MAAPLIPLATLALSAGVAGYSMYQSSQASKAAQNAASSLANPPPPAPPAITPGSKPGTGTSSAPTNPFSSLIAAAAGAGQLGTTAGKTLLGQ